VRVENFETSGIPDWKATRDREAEKEPKTEFFVGMSMEKIKKVNKDFHKNPFKAPNIYLLYRKQRTENVENHVENVKRYLEKE
jgi:hypothetical protein